MGQNDNQMLVDGEGYQTVTLVPSETAGGEVSYVLVVQEETKPVVDIDIKVAQVIIYFILISHIIYYTNPLI